MSPFIPPPLASTEPPASQSAAAEQPRGSAALLLCHYTSSRVRGTGVLSYLILGVLSYLILGICLVSGLTGQLVSLFSAFAPLFAVVAAVVPYLGYHLWLALVLTRTLQATPTPCQGYTMLYHIILKCRRHPGKKYLKRSKFREALSPRV